MHIFTNKHWLINLLTLIDSQKHLVWARMQEVSNKGINIIKSCK